MFREFFIGRCFVQLGICYKLGSFVISTDEADYTQWLSIQTVGAIVNDTEMAIVQLIIGPIMIGIGALNA